MSLKQKSGTSAGRYEDVTYSSTKQNFLWALSTIWIYYIISESVRSLPSTL